MGLISHAHTIRPDPSYSETVKVDKKKTGLLDRVLNTSGYDQLVTAFSRIINHTQTERACVLVGGVDTSNLGSLLLHHGLDLTTVKRFLPDMKVIKENYPDNSTWYILTTEKELTFFHSLFSSHEWSSVLSILIKPVYTQGLDPFYIILCKSKLDILKKDINIINTEPLIIKLQDILSHNSLLVSSLQFSGSFIFSEQVAKNHILSALNAKKNATLACFHLDALFSENTILNTDPVQLSLLRSLTYIIARLAGSSNLISMNDSGKIFGVFFSSQKVDSDLYFHQMLGPLEKTFGLQRVSRIRMEVFGTSISVSEILRFLSGET